MAWAGASISGPEAFDLLASSISAIERAYPDDAGTVVRKTLAHAVLAALSPKQDRKVGDQLLAAIEGSAFQPPVGVWTCARPLRGAELRKGRPVQLGPFTVWQWPTHAHKYFPKEAAEDLKDDDDLNREKPVFVTLRGPRARESERAEELADIEFERFEDLLHFVLRRAGDAYDVGIFSFREDHWLRHFVHADDARASHGMTRGGARILVPLDGPFVTSATSGHARLWEIVGLETRTEMQNRIVTAAEWIGRARRDRHRGKAFAQCVFALEALLTYDDGKLVSPGLTYRMTETCAYLLGDDPESRKSVDDAVREIYGVRSGIVHGGEKSVSAEKLELARELTAKVLTKLLTDPGLQAISKPRDLSDWVRDRKYA
jgi:hypothetical protein